MIDLKQELQSFSHIDLKNLSENVDNIPDNIKNSIILYNKALDNLNSKSEDIAIIELKKAVSLNPDFHEAMNLLGICYSYIQDYSKASEVFEKVMKAEKNSIDALRLLNSIDAEEKSVPAKGGKKKAKAVINEKKAAETKNTRLNENKDIKTVDKKIAEASIFAQKLNGTTKNDLIKYALGCVIGALVVFFVSLPFYSSKKAEPVSNTVDTNKENTSKLENDYNSIKLQLDETNDKYEKLEKDKADSDKQVDYYKNAVKLFDIDTLIAQKSYEAAADKLILLKDIGFKGAEKKKFDSQCNNVMPKAAWAAYSAGLNLLNTRKYQDALGKLSKVKLYKSDLAYLDSTYYSIGVCYINLNDSKSALDMFQKVIGTYPKSQYAIYSQSRINEITGRP